MEKKTKVTTPVFYLENPVDRGAHGLQSVGITEVKLITEHLKHTQTQTHTEHYKAGESSKKVRSAQPGTNC